MNRVRLLIAITALLAATPAMASAATIEVDTAAEFVAAGEAAKADDIIHVAAGVYSANVDVKSEKVTIQADAGALLVNAADATGPTLLFSATAGTSPDVVVGLTVLNVASGGASAIQVGAPGLTLQRSVAYSLKGDALTSAAAAGSPNRTITVDSSALVAQTAEKATIRATAANLLPLVGPAAPAGTTTIRGRHVTALGDSTVILDNSGANGVPGGGGAGNMTATFTDSILLGKRSAKTNPGSALVAANTATIDVATRNKVADTSADANALFVNPSKLNLHLRADAAEAIDKGGVTEGEADKDLDGDARSAGGVSDLGADEFANRAPTAVLSGPTGTVRQNVPATFTAAKSSDPEASYGGGITKYRWDFGDGTTAETTTPTTTHAYAEKKTYSVTVTVTDKQGAVSTASAPASVEVIDGVLPTITLAQPSAKQKINLYRPKTKRRVRVVFFGTAQDDVAVDQVVLLLRPVKLSNGKCRWFDGKTRLKAASCTNPIALKARLSGANWRYSIPLKAKLPKGPYRLLAVAVDASGLPSVVKSVDFRLR